MSMGCMEGEKWVSMSILQSINLIGLYPWKIPRRIQGCFKGWELIEDKACARFFNW